MSAIGPIKFSPSQVSTDYASLTMKNIQTLQKQYRDVGERYQKEVVAPQASGSAEQELLRELAREMAGIKQEIDALEHAIIEHQALDAIKSRDGIPVKRASSQATVPGNTAVEQAAVSSDTTGESTTGVHQHQDDAKKQNADSTQLVGSLINTTA